MLDTPVLYMVARSVGAAACKALQAPQLPIQNRSVQGFVFNHIK